LPAYAQVTRTVLHTFSGTTDGGAVYGGLRVGESGELYGTTGYGGSSAPACRFGCGTAFKLTPPARDQTAWTLTTLWNFSGTDGDLPFAALFAPDEGSFPLYGTTTGLEMGNGTVFKLTGKVLTTLWSFSGGSGGAFPSGSVITGRRGALYGMAGSGGNLTAPACIGFGCGTVFAIHDDPGSLTTIWTFSGDDGNGPSGTLLADETGALYGTTYGGGAYGNGTIFKLTPPAPGQTAWALTTLWHFTGGSDGANPLAGLGAGALIADETGALYGTTANGGDLNAPLCFGFGCGTVFRLSPPARNQTAWTLSTLYAFSGGEYPIAGLIADRKGALYGTSALGGPDNPLCGFGTCGVVFKLTPSASRDQTPWNETVLLSFSGTDGAFPNAGLAADKNGVLYGTTQMGGSYSPPLCTYWGCGVAFQLTGTGFATEDEQ
jgi:uncharacterized repeat protein (TIGR03803 family)